MTYISPKESVSRSINTLADFFTELYLHYCFECGGGLESLAAQLDNVLSAANLNKLINGEAYVNPICFQYFRLKSPFVISQPKLAKLNLGIIMRNPNAVQIDFDSKQLNRLVRDAIKAKAASRRQKKSDYVKKYKKENPEKFLKSARASRQRSRERRKAAEKVCPAYRYFLGLKKNKDYKFVRELITITPHWEGAKSYKKWVVKREKRRYFNEGDFMTLEERFNYTRNPIKACPKCDALKKSDPSLCPFIKDPKNISQEAAGSCDLKSVFIFPDAAANIRFYIKHMDKSLKYSYYLWIGEIYKSLLKVRNTIKLRRRIKS